MEFFWLENSYDTALKMAAPEEWGLKNED